MSLWFSVHREQFDEIIQKSILDNLPLDLDNTDLDFMPIVGAVLSRLLMVTISNALTDVENSFILSLIVLIIGFLGDAGIIYGAYSLLIKPIFNLMDINYYEMCGIVAFIMIIFIDKIVTTNNK